MLNEIQKQEGWRHAYKDVDTDGVIISCINRVGICPTNYRWILGCTNRFTEYGCHVGRHVITDASGDHYDRHVAGVGCVRIASVDWRTRWYCCLYGTDSRLYVWLVADAASVRGHHAFP